MNWFKKPASPTIRNIFWATFSITIIVMIVIEQYVASIVFALILIKDIFNHKTNKKHIEKKTKPISDDVAKAMANKIKFEAEQHRKNRYRHNYIKTTSNDEE